MHHAVAPNSLAIVHIGDREMLVPEMNSLGQPLELGSIDSLVRHSDEPSYARVLVIVGIKPGAGTGLVRQVRMARADCGIIAAVRDRATKRLVSLLEAGADACLSLPCDVELVRASVNALIRRLLADWSPHEDGVHLSPEQRALRIGRRIVELRRTEYRICEYLILNRGRWVSERELLRNVLDMRHDRETSLVRVHIRQIRKAFGELSSCVVSKRGHGYQFCVVSRNDLANVAAVNASQAELRKQAEAAAADRSSCVDAWDGANPDVVRWQQGEVA